MYTIYTVCQKATPSFCPYLGQILTILENFSLAHFVVIYRNLGMKATFLLSLFSIFIFHKLAQLKYGGIFSSHIIASF